MDIQNVKVCQELKPFKRYCRNTAIYHASETIQETEDVDEIGPALYDLTQVLVTKSFQTSVTSRKLIICCFSLVRKFLTDKETCWRSQWQFNGLRVLIWLFSGLRRQHQVKEYSFEIWHLLLGAIKIEVVIPMVVFEKRTLCWVRYHPWLPLPTASHCRSTWHHIILSNQ